MANPQTENGFTKIANELLEQIYKADFNATQLKIILLIMRYTYGFNRKEHEISVGFISKGTGISRRYVSSELNKLIDRKIVKIVKEHTDSTSRILSLNKHYNEWFDSKLQQMNNTSSGEQNYDTTGEELFTTTGEELFTQERKIKEKLNKNTTTTIEDNLQETGNKNPVARVDADSTKQDEVNDKTLELLNNIYEEVEEEKPLEKIENYYKKIIGRPVIGSNDLQEILLVYEKYKDIDFIIRCMNQAADNNKQRYGRITITSFRYFKKVIEEEWQKREIKKQADNVVPIKQEYKAQQPNKYNPYENAW